MKIILTISVLCALFFLPIIVNAQDNSIKLALGHHHCWFPSQSIVKANNHYHFSQNKIDSVMLTGDTLLVYLNKGDLTAVVNHNRVIAIEMTASHFHRRLLYLPLFEVCGDNYHFQYVIFYFGHLRYYFQKHNNHRYLLSRCEEDFSIENITNQRIPCRPPDH